MLLSGTDDEVVVLCSAGLGASELVLELLLEDSSGGLTVELSEDSSGTLDVLEDLLLDLLDEEVEEEESDRSLLVPSLVTHPASESVITPAIKIATIFFIVIPSKNNLLIIL